MKLNRTMIAYTPSHFEEDAYAGAIVAGPWPDKTGWSDPYSFTVGACYSNRHGIEKWQAVALMFTDFHAAVVRDGIDPAAAHAAFLAIDEYRDVISPDIAGASPGEIL